MGKIKKMEGEARQLIGMNFVKSTTSVLSVKCYSFLDYYVSVCNRLTLFKYCKLNNLAIAMQKLKCDSV